MDFDDAALEHISWKHQLIDYLSHPDGHLRPCELSSDRNCRLGQWIHGEGSQYSKFPEYDALVKQHARFHRQAGGLVSGANLGLSVRSEAVLEEDTEYGEASAAVITAIMGLRAKVGGGVCATAVSTESKKALPPLIWGKPYSVEVAELDEHHKYLFILINILQTAFEKNEKRSTAEMVLDQLSDYSDYHFKAEEELMDRVHYPDLLAHRREHEQFVQRIAGFKQQATQRFEIDSAAIVDFLRQWIVEHLQRVDRKYSSYMHAAGVR